MNGDRLLDDCSRHFHERFEPRDDTAEELGHLRRVELLRRCETDVDMRQFFMDEEEAPELVRKSQQIRDEIAPSITGMSQLLGKP